MDKASVADALLALTSEMANRSKIAQLREVFQHIEEAQRAGVKNARIVETLNALGFKLDLKSFEMMLYRIRKQRKADLREGTGTPAAAPLDLPLKKGTDQATPPGEPRKITNPATPKLGPGTQPNSEGSAPEETSPAVDDLSGLDKKQRRERLGDQFITPETTNPLWKRIKEQKK